MVPIAHCSVKCPVGSENVGQSFSLQGPQRLMLQGSWESIRDAGMQTRTSSSLLLLVDLADVSQSSFPQVWAQPQILMPAPGSQYQ